MGGAGEPLPLPLPPALPLFSGERGTRAALTKVMHNERGEGEDEGEERRAEAGTEGKGNDTTSEQRQDPRPQHGSLSRANGTERQGEQSRPTVCTVARLEPQPITQWRGTLCEASKAQNGIGEAWLGRRAMEQRALGPAKTLHHASSPGQGRASIGAASGHGNARVGSRRHDGSSRIQGGLRGAARDKNGNRAAASRRQGV